VNFRRPRFITRTRRSELPCCGKGRIARPVQRKVSPALPSAAPVSRSSPAPSPRRALEPVLFKYTGHSGMTVFGPITGLRYRFPAPGAVIAIDPRDAPSVTTIPRLERIAG
jgi:hypothetical protein